MYYEYKTKTYFILDDFFFIWVWVFFFLSNINFKIQDLHIPVHPKIKYLINIIQPNYLSSLF